MRYTFTIARHPVTRYRVLTIADGTAETTFVMGVPELAALRDLLTGELLTDSAPTVEVVRTTG